MTEINQWTRQLHGLYNQAVAKYKAGERGASTYFSPEEVAFLASIGLKPINLYDYAEDTVNSSEPDWDTVLLMVSARRDYFLHQMHGKWTAVALRESDLPAKSEALDGIEWLPRVIPKAEAYLSGGLPEEIMFCCGGDRRFFKANNVHPADFLRIVWSAKGDVKKIVQFVKAARGDS